ncbi:MAG: hypothetical protein R3B06_00225 [Kofleriaceae bacterium]
MQAPQLIRPIRIIKNNLSKRHRCGLKVFIEVSTGRNVRPGDLYSASIAHHTKSQKHPPTLDEDRTIQGIKPEWPLACVYEPCDENIVDSSTNEHSSQFN